MTDEVEDGGTGPKISSVSGVNRKRKWKEEEEEDDGVESSGGDTSSDDDSGADGAEETARPANQPSVGQETDVGQELKEEEEEVVAHSSEQKEVETCAPQPKEVPVKRPSQPVVFIPVDRLPDIQVRCHQGTVIL